MGGTHGIKKVQRSDIPNLISVARAFLVLPVVSALMAREFQPALLWFAIASLSDGIDGMIARRFGWHSRLGSLLDPVADKLLLGLSYGCLSLLDLLPSWLAGLVIGRDLLIFAVSVMLYLRLAAFQGTPSHLSKLNTFSQIVLILGVIFSQSHGPLPAEVLPLMMHWVALTTLLSGFHYLTLFGKTAISTFHP